MIDDPLDLPATPARLRGLAERGALSDAALARALALAEASPPPAAWREHLSRVLLGLGASLSLAGCVCFIAFNWSRLGRFAKLGAVEAAIVGCTLLAWRALPRLSGRVALSAAAVLVGPLLAVYGQTYQTGADPFELFLAWAALIVPWAVTADLPALWLVWLSLADTALVLYWEQVRQPRTVPEHLALFLLLAAIHTAALAGWEVRARRPGAAAFGRWMPRAVATIGFLALVPPAAVGVIVPEEAGTAGALGWLALAAALAAAISIYRTYIHDLFVLAAGGLATMVVAATVVGRVVFKDARLEIGGFFLTGLFVVAELSLAVRWLRRAARAQAEE